MKGRIMLSLLLTTVGVYLMKKTGFNVKIKIRLWKKKHQRSHR